MKVKMNRTASMRTLYNPNSIFPNYNKPTSDFFQKLSAIFLSSSVRNIHNLITTKTKDSPGVQSGTLRVPSFSQPLLNYTLPLPTTTFPI